MTTQSIYKSPAGERAVLAQYEALLERWPVAHTHIEIPTRHGITFVIMSGQETLPPLVLLHGAGSNSASWLGDIVQYSKQFCVYAIDLIGEPGKSAPNRPSWEGPAYVEWLEDVLAGLKITQASFIGLSQGGWIALKFAFHRPTQMAKLVLLSPGGIVPDNASFLLKVIPLMFLGRWGVRQINRMIMAGLEIPREIEDGLIETMSHFKTRLGALPIFSDGELQSLQMPILLMIGAKDVLRDAKKIQARLQPLVPHLRIEIVPDGGHALINTAPQILPFLTK